MEAIGIIGMVFGITAMGIANELKKEVRQLKENLIEKGVIDENSKNE